MEIQEPITNKFQTVKMLNSKNGFACNTYMRLFVNSALRKAQDRYLAKFVSANFASLTALKILINQSARRNEGWPRGSGKEFRHCHGGDVG